MRYLIFAAAILLLASCSREENAQTIRDQISAHKKEVNDLNNKIAQLESRLATMESGLETGKAMAVRTLTLQYEPFRHYIQVSGSAEAVNEAYISPEVSGQLRELYVREGDYVTRGKLLARLNTEVTQSSLAEMQSALDLATTVYEKQKRLWDQKIGSEIQYLNAKNNKESLEQRMKTLNAQLDMAMIKSPVNGIVDKINLKTGELAMPGFELMQIVNLDEVFINADVSERYLAVVKEGEMVDVEFPVYPELDIQVPIYRKGNVINPNNRTFTVQLKLKNSEQKIKPNILTVININDFSADSALVVPAALIKQDISGSYIYAVEENGSRKLARKIYVEPGRSYNDRTMVVKGLKEGQMIITDGFNMVSDGSEVTIKAGDAS